jgi:glycosyltransferase involved in cell wall biosynthesis
LPVTVMEAMSMGRPIITTDVPGCRETVKNAENGYLVAAKDPFSLSNAMENFILNPHLICKFGKESRKMAERKYDINEINTIILSILNLCK